MSTALSRLSAVAFLLSGCGGQPAETRIHHTLAYAVGGPRSVAVVRVDDDGTNRRLLARLAGYHSVIGLAWSSDGRRLLVSRAKRGALRSVYSVPGEGGAARFIAMTQSPPRLSPDGRSLLVARSGLILLNAVGIVQRKLAHGTIADPTWSPDGERIAFIRETTSCDRYVVGRGWECSVTHSELQTIGRDGTGLRTLARTNVESESLFSGPVWLPDGKSLLVAQVDIGGSGRLRLIATDGESESTILGPNTPEWAAVDPSGERIALQSERGIELLSLKDDQKRELLELHHGVEGRFAADVSWSPDGRKLAYISFEDFKENLELRVIGADGSGDHRVSRAGESVEAFAWRPTDEE